MSCPSNDLAIALTFFLTAIFSSLFTVLLTLLIVRVYIIRDKLTRKELVKPFAINLLYKIVGLQ